METARFHFLPDLPFFLARQWQEGIVDCAFESGQSVKHLVESLGVPHTEVGSVALNGMAARLEDLPRTGNRVEVRPASAATGPQPPALRFVLDNHLGRLAAYLRMIGLDTLYRNDYQDEELARIAEQEERILVTRDRRLLMRRAVRYGYCPRSLDSGAQLVEVVKRFGLLEQIRPFERCLRCNEPLKRVSKEEVIDRLEPLTRLYYDDFHACPRCGQVYWKGSHYERMLSRVEALRSEGG